jgi:hypothetical protein
MHTLNEHETESGARGSSNPAAKQKRENENHITGSKNNFSIEISSWFTLNHKGRAPSLI